MKTKIIFTALALFAVLAVSGTRAYARSLESEKAGSLIARQEATHFMLKNGIQIKEDRSMSEKSGSSLSSESGRERELGEDRSSSSTEEKLSSPDKSSGEYIGTVPTMPAGQTYLADDSKSSGYESESASSTSKDESTSSSQESHSGTSADSTSEHSSELNDR